MLPARCLASSREPLGAAHVGGAAPTLNQLSPSGGESTQCRGPRNKTVDCARRRIRGRLLDGGSIPPPSPVADYIEASTCEDFIEVIRIGRCCGNAPPRPWRRGRGLARLGKCARDGPRLREVKVGSGGRSSERGYSWAEDALGPGGCP